MTEEKKVYKPPKKPTIEEIEEIKTFCESVSKINREFSDNKIVKSFFNQTEKNAMAKICNISDSMANRIDARMNKISDEIRNGSERREILRAIQKMSTEEIVKRFKIDVEKEN